MICLAWGGVRHVLCWSSQEGAGATAMSEDWLCNLNHVKSPEMQKKKKIYILSCIIFMLFQ